MKSFGAQKQALLGLVLAGIGAFFACQSPDGTAGPANAGTDPASVPAPGARSTAGSAFDGSTSACPKAYKCGYFKDANGRLISCGKRCLPNELCDNRTHTCVDGPQYCSGRKCGLVPDACGSLISCGDCPVGKVCSSSTFECTDPPPPGDAGCGILSCDLANGQQHCGPITDGCGNRAECTCTAPEVCGGGGFEICGVFPECVGSGANAGPVLNACGNSYVDCAPCVPNPDPCKNTHCGYAWDGCSKVIACPAGVLPCDAGSVCVNGQCCTPNPCPDISNVGCNAWVDLGCGGPSLCNTCSPGTECVNGTCQDCQPKTCADFNGEGCGYKDFGCNAGGQECHPCGPGQICLGNGTCCNPSGCNGRTGPVDDGCGQTIHCGGNIH